MCEAALENSSQDGSYNIFGGLAPVRWFYLFFHYSLLLLANIRPSELQEPC